MERCITYCVYMASHTGLLTDTRICGFIWVVLKHMRLQVEMFFSLFQVWMRTLLLLLRLQQTAVATSTLQASVGTETPFFAA